MNAVKGPRRRAWWICGAIVALVALFALLSLASLARANRTEQALEEFIQEFGFREVIPEDNEHTIYSAPVRDEQRADDALRQIMAACEGMDVRVKKAFKPSGDNADTHEFNASGGTGHVERVRFLADWKLRSDGAAPDMLLIVVKVDERVQLLERLQRLWPW